MINKQHFEAAVMDARVFLPCEVVEFIQNEGEEPFVNVKISIKQKQYPQNATEVIKFFERPEVHEIPILYPSTAKYAITIPIAPGDRGWLVFADFDIDSWNIEDNPVTVSGRFHDLNDAVFMPGGWPRPRFMDGYSDEWLEIRDLASTTRIALKDGDIHLQALLWQMVLRESGFDVVAGEAEAAFSLMDALIQMADAGFKTNTALGLETVLTQKAVYAASVVAYGEAVTALTILKGESMPPERLPELFDRPSDGVGPPGGGTV